MMELLGVKWGDDEGGEGEAGAGLGGGSLGHPPVKLSETVCFVRGSGPAEAYLPGELWFQVLLPVLSKSTPMGEFRWYETCRYGFCIEQAIPKRQYPLYPT